MTPESLTAHSTQSPESSIHSVIAGHKKNISKTEHAPPESAPSFNRRISPPATAAGISGRSVAAETWRFVETWRLVTSWD